MHMANLAPKGSWAGDLRGLSSPLVSPAARPTSQRAGGDGGGDAFRAGAATPTKSPHSAQWLPSSTWIPEPSPVTTPASPLPPQPRNAVDPSRVDAQRSERGPLHAPSTGWAARSDMPHPINPPELHAVLPAAAVHSTAVAVASSTLALEVCATQLRGSWANQLRSPTRSDHPATASRPPPFEQQNGHGGGGDDEQQQHEPRSPAKPWVVPAVPVLASPARFFNAPALAALAPQPLGVVDAARVDAVRSDRGPLHHTPLRSTELGTPPGPRAHQR